MSGPMPNSIEEILKRIEDSRVQEEVHDAWMRDQLNRRLNDLTGSVLPASTPMPADDPAQMLKSLNQPSVPTVFKEGCYICRDSEFAQMGLPLCFACLDCGGHVAADDVECDECGEDQRDLYERRSQ